MEHDQKLIEKVRDALCFNGVIWVSDLAAMSRAAITAVRAYDAASSQASLDDCPHIKSVMNGSVCAGWDRYDWEALRRELRAMLKLEPTP